MVTSSAGGWLSLRPYFIWADYISIRCCLVFTSLSVRVVVVFTEGTTNRWLSLPPTITERKLSLLRGFITLLLCQWRSKSISDYYHSTLRMPINKNPNTCTHPHLSHRRLWINVLGTRFVLTELHVLKLVLGCFLNSLLLRGIMPETHRPHLVQHKTQWVRRRGCWVRSNGRRSISGCAIRKITKTFLHHPQLSAGEYKSKIYVIVFDGKMADGY